MSYDGAMRHIHILILVTAGFASAQEKPAIGYQDTPLLPGTKWHVHDGERPRPLVMKPGPFVSLPRPADAKVLFGGANLDAWTGKDDKASWSIDGGELVVNKTGDIRTREEFGDIHLHLEWCAPKKAEGSGQGRGNSGVFLMGRYEVQVLDSFENATYADGQAAAIYGQYPPLFNVCRAPGEWQTYDIIFRAPVFKDEKLVTPAVITVIHNGIVVHNNRAILGPTSHKSLPSYKPHGEKGPIRLQDHGNPVRYRNIWVRPL